ncbi:MAG: DUF2158 domain-containing protein [Aeromonas sp.]
MAASRKIVFCNKNKELQMQIGSIVYLNSGSPAMTVTNIVDPEYRVCSWIDGAGVPHQQNYHVAALELDDPVEEVRISFP